MHMFTTHTHAVQTHIMLVVGFLIGQAAHPNIPSFCSVLTQHPENPQIVNKLFSVNNKPTKHLQTYANAVLNKTTAQANNQA